MANEKPLYKMKFVEGLEKETISILQEQINYLGIDHPVDLTTLQKTLRGRNSSFYLSGSLLVGSIGHGGIVAKIMPVSYSETI